MYEAARAAGRTLVLDLYTATLNQAANAPGVPILGDEGLEVLCRRRERMQVKEAGGFGRTDAVRGVRVFPESLAPRASQLVVMLRPSMIGELEWAGALPGALAIWSMWRGYLERPLERRMTAAFTARGVPLEVHHASGHAFVTDLNRLEKALDPCSTIAIHIAEPARYVELISGSTRHPDGAWWYV